MNIPGLHALKNQINVAKWKWRVHLQGGCSHWRARDLQDHRNDEDRAIWRRNEQKLRDAKREKARRKGVVNLAKLRIERARKAKAS